MAHSQDCLDGCRCYHCYAKMQIGCNNGDCSHVSPIQKVAQGLFSRPRKREMRNRPPSVEELGNNQTGLTIIKVIRDCIWKGCSHKSG